MHQTSRLELTTGVSLNTYVDGSQESEAILFLHGFPESHATWRNQLQALASEFNVIAPDQRGFADSDKPMQISDYTPDVLVADILALADRLGLKQFNLVGHDWGGAVAWAFALKHPERLKRLLIINGAHPFIFQKQLFDNAEQRAASQYINDYRRTDFELEVQGMGWDAFFDRCFASLDNVEVTEQERKKYIEQWSRPGALSAMLNWYRATPLMVPKVGETPERPSFLDRPFAPVLVPTHVLWGKQDHALHPSLLDGLQDLVPQLSITKIDGGHFLPWQSPEQVNGFIRDAIVN